MAKKAKPTVPVAAGGYPKWFYKGRWVMVHRWAQFDDDNSLPAPHYHMDSNNEWVQYPTEG